MLTSILGAATGVMWAMATVLWALSLRVRDASIADIAWGPGFALVAWLGAAMGEGDRGRSVLVAVLVTVWAVRLTAFLAVRRRTAGREDPRYTAIRECRGRHFTGASDLTGKWG